MKVVYSARPSLPELLPGSSLFDIIIVIGMGITSLFAGRQFMAALISDSYNIQSYFRDSSEFYEARKNDNKLTTESESKSSIDS